MRPVVGRVLQREYTDLCVVIGPNVRWVEEDYRDLVEKQPEVLLGYRVLLTTTDDIERTVMGRRPAKIVILDAGYDFKQLRAISRAVASLNLAYPELKPRVERWYVHRARGIYQVA